MVNRKEKIVMNLRTLIKLGLVMSFAFVLWSCDSAGGKDNADDNDSDVESRIKPVKTVTLAEQTISRSFEYSANLTAYEELYLAPSTPGRIVKIYPQVGDRVPKGQLLVEMDPTQLNQAIMQLSSLERDFERFDSLIKFGGIPQQQYDQLKTQLDITKQNVEFLRENTNIKAPFNGIIASRHFEDGELFSGAPNTQMGKAAILVVQQINPIKATIAVSERLFPEIKTGMSVSLRSDIYPDEEFEGKIFRIHPTINPASKTFNVEVKVPNSKELLRTGMFARINLELGQTPGILVPSNVVLQQQGTNERYVFLRVNGKAQKVSVNIGNRYDDNLEIISDKLKPGDEIIITGHSNLLDGDLIEVVK
jgi:membrane fusion protein, multidrug efflux system